MRSIILIDGKKQSKLSVFNRLTQFGDGVFETCLFAEGRLLFWAAHFSRLEKGRTQLKINPIAQKFWLKDIAKALSIAKLNHGVVKIILSRGTTMRGYGFEKNIHPTRVVIVSKMPEKIPQKYTLTTCRSGYSSNQLLSAIKHCNRLEQILARSGMSADECIMLDENQQVISVTQGNIFAIRSGVLLTPDLSKCGIEGTRRTMVLAVANDLNLQVRIKALSLPELLDCDEIFITNAVIGVKPVNEINGHLFNSDNITQRIQDAVLSLQNSPKHSKPVQHRRYFSWSRLLIILLLLLGIWLYSVKDINLQKSTIYHLPAGANIHSVASNLENLGYIDSAKYMFVLAKLLNKDEKLKHGYYQLMPNMGIATLLNNFANAQVAKRKITLVEGKTIFDYYQQLSQNKALKSVGNFNQTMQLTGIKPPYEGYFWADTYRVNYGDSVVSVLKLAHQIMQQKLASAWQNRAKNLPLKNADEALILASLIEKETAHNQEKSKIAGVFIRRLQKGMRLQTDPSVIYALGKSYHGTLKKQDLKFNSLYNTYRHQGLPPTPISSVSASSLNAAMHPEAGDALYFVAKKDGTHAFAKTYQQHRLNIKKYLK